MNIPPGKYVAIAIAQDSALAETSNGTPQVAVVFQIQEPPEQYGERITWFGFLTEKATPRTIEGLRAAGFTGDDLTDLSSLGSKNCEIVVEDEEYEGKTYTKVKWVNDLGRGHAVKGVLNEDGRRALAAKMKNAFRAFDASNGKPAATRPAATTTRAPAPSRRPEPPPLGDSDAPF